MADAHGAHGVLVDVRNRLEIFDDGDEVLVVEGRAGLEHTAVAADAVGKILGRLGAFVGVGNFVAIIHSDHHVAPGDHAVLHLCQALGKLFDFLHAFATFAPAHGDGGERAVAFRFADEDGDIDFITGEDESVVAGDVGTLDRFAGHDVTVWWDGFGCFTAGAELGSDVNSA